MHEDVKSTLFGVLLINWACTASFTVIDVYIITVRLKPAALQQKQFHARLAGDFVSDCVSSEDAVLMHGSRRM